jgi:preprotein translocase subunit SecD
MIRQSMMRPSDTPWGQFVRVLVAVFAVTAAAWGIGQSIAKAEEIALSLVNPKGRIDIPVTALEQVQGYATKSFRNAETGAVREIPTPHVDVCVAKEFKERICELTTRSVNEAVAVVVDCETVVKPIVREPLCTQSCFSISTNDLAEANALARRIRRGANRACAPSL